MNVCACNTNIQYTYILNVYEFSPFISIFLVRFLLLPLVEAALVIPTRGPFDVVEAGMMYQNLAEDVHCLPGNLSLRKIEQFPQEISEYSRR